MNTKKIFIVFIGLVFVAITAVQATATVVLSDWAFNVNGAFSGFVDPVPTGLDDSSFDWGTGLGTITMTMNSGNYFGAFFDHEIHDIDDTFFNEYGTANGSVASGQTWEIDEPGYVSGDIYENSEFGGLDNGIGTSIYGNTTFPDDVSMALAWDFSLGADETAIITLNLCNSLDIGCTTPTGFYLAQSDEDSSEIIYFSGDLSIESTTTAPVPEPSTFLLFGTGLAGLLGFRRKKV